MGMVTAKVFALAIRKNRTLRYLDLESNNLTNDTEENSGVEEMINALQENTTLLSLNMANNRLGVEIGRNFVDLFNPRGKCQESLIDFEFGFNDFRLEDVSNPPTFISNWNGVPKDSSIFHNQTNSIVVSRFAKSKTI